GRQAAADSARTSNRPGRTRLVGAGAGSQLTVMTPSSPVGAVLPVRAQGVAVVRVAGPGPGGGADALGHEADAAVPQADVHAARVGRLAAAGVAGPEVRRRLDLEQEAGGVARLDVLVRGIVAHDRPPRQGRVGPERGGGVAGGGVRGQAAGAVDLAEED